MVHYLTANGLKDLQEEYQKIDKVEIPHIITAINEALEQGDLKENSELETAKIDRDNLVVRKNELEEILANYEIIAEVSNSKNITIGNTVTIEYAHDNSSFTLKIVGSSEADAVANKISNESPLAIAILGKTEGAEVDFKVKTKPFKVKIIKIQS
jgi:transcription elongation factor GreA